VISITVLYDDPSAIAAIVQWISDNSSLDKSFSFMTDGEIRSEAIETPPSPDEQRLA
jgi:hypothetical protein